MIFSDIIHYLPQGPKSYHKRSLKVVDTIVVHHSGVDNQTAINYARHHVNTLKWPGIGYHFIIEKTGAIYMCNHLDTVSYHVRGSNTRSVGICLSGNHDNTMPEHLQMVALTRLIPAILDMLPSVTRLMGHREMEGANTTCPGKHIDMDSIRKMFRQWL